MADYIVTLDEDSIAVVEAQDIEEAAALTFKVFDKDWRSLYSPEEWAMFTSETDTVYQEVARIRRCTDEGFSAVVNRHFPKHVTCPRSKDCSCREGMES